MHPGDSFFRILCVDDNFPMQWALKMGLGMYGFEVILASHGIEALSRYKTHSGNFRAIVTDHDMPQMNGLEFGRSVREIGFKGLIIVISGQLKDLDCQAYQGLGISSFLHKPFRMNLLAAMLLENKRT